MSFPTKVVAAVPLEGDYTTWTHVWTRDYGAAIDLYNVRVDNSGTVYTEDRSTATFVKTYGGAETNIDDYMFFMWEVFPDPMSATGKYFLGWPMVPCSEFEVWKDGVQTFNRDIQLDEVDAVEIYSFAVSPNGRFVAIISYNAAFDLRIVMLYEGS